MTEFWWIDRSWKKYIERRPIVLWINDFSMNHSRMIPRVSPSWKLQNPSLFLLLKDVWYQTCSDFKVLTSSNTFDGSFIVCNNFVINLWHSSQFQAILKYRRQPEWNVNCLQLQLGPGVELRTVLMLGNLGCGKFLIVPRHFIKIVVEFHIGCRWCCQAQTCNLSMLHITQF